MGLRNPALCFDDYAKSLAELKAYRAKGGGAIVDAQPVAAGRDAPALEALSRGSGVHIVACTGYHLLGFYPENSWIHVLEENDLFALYHSELTQGMLPPGDDSWALPRTRTAVKAGMVKAAIPAEGAVGRYEILLRAAARAAAATGIPLMLHTEAGKNAAAAVRLCFAQGVRPEKLVVCHVDRQAEDFAPHEAVADMGVYLDYDTVGRFKYHSDEVEIALLRHMVRRGHGRQLMLALDTTAARLGAYGGEISLNYLLETFLPRLAAVGFSPALISGFNHENCQRLFY